MARPRRTRVRCTPSPPPAAFTMSSSSNRSGVWKYFALKEKDKKAQCNLCPKALAYSGGTSSLWRHVSTIHKIKISRSAEQNLSSAPKDTDTEKDGLKQMSMENSFARSNKPSRIEAVAYLAAKDRISFRTIAESKILRMCLDSLGMDAPCSATTVSK